MFKVCFVCLGNICRSPLAQGIFENLVSREGLEEKISTSSAGVGGWHAGSPPDGRMQEVANKYGIHLGSRGRQIQQTDFFNFHLILAMDQSNMATLEKICPDSKIMEKIMPFRSFDPEATGNLDVPDPYYGGSKGFETVYRIIDRTCPKVLDFIKDRASLNA